MTDLTDYLAQRAGVWIYYRRVPTEYADLDGRRFVRISTKVRVANDRTGTKAGRVAAKINATQEAYWRGLTDGRADAKRSYADAVRVARSLGLDYLLPDQIAQQPLADIIQRVETLITDRRIEHPGTRMAVLGGVEKPRIMLSDLFSEFEQTQKTALSKMSPDQVRKWTSAKKRAVEILIGQRGDKALQELTREDALAYADFWETRTIEEGISPSSANKNISHIGGMIRAVDKRLQLRLDHVFAGTRIEGGRDGKRHPFTVEHIRQKILAPGALDGLNDQARDVVLVCLETGARPSEIVNLSKSRIVLDAEVPHIKIAAEGRLLKTETSVRDIPLVGLALAAMLRHRSGFPRYFDKGSNLSAVVMKHFKAHELLPSPKHSVYSLRHAFKDRLKAAEGPEEMIDELMGHNSSKPAYGVGYSLEAKRKYLQAICFKSSDSKVRKAA
jgi:integrase